MIAENNDPGDYPEDEFDDYSDDGSFEEDQFDEEYEEYEEDYQSSEQRSTSSSGKKRRKKMFCKHCNRMETHRRTNNQSWLQSYVTGLFFGLNRLFGPFKCTCCGNNRWYVLFTRAGVKVGGAK